MALNEGTNPFRALKITGCGQQPGFLTAPSSEFLQRPDVARYRNNSVAFSQYHDLCFVAARARILVHFPIYLDQTLLPHRSVIDIANTNTGLLGYIDPGHPHSINHLVVADLGFEELVIVVCDDGDVVAYEVRKIRKEIDQHGSDYNTPCFISDIQPYFLRNVGMSAWGIAVHQDARLIAVSSNSTRIHVFAFALRKTRCGNSSDESNHDLDFDSPPLSSREDAGWVRPTAMEHLEPFNRSHNLELVLSGHKTNIPSLAFYNPSSGSTKDNFLVSTDIDGITYVWDVWQRIPFAELTASPNHSRGWGVTCVDPFFACQAESDSELFGLELEREYSRANMGSVIVTTDALQFVPGYESRHFTLRKRLAQIWGPAMHELPGDIDSDSEIPGFELMTEFDNDDGSSEEDSVEDDCETDRSATSRAITPFQNGSSEFIAGSDRVIEMTGKRLPFNVLYTNQLDILLCNSIRLSLDHDPDMAKKNVVACRSALDQRLSPRDLHIARLQRLNLVLQVPELGLVVVGDQTGRVALVTMTRRRRNKQLGIDDEVGFRIEGFLPSKPQEDAGQRPQTELHGVAVGPVQGHERKRTDVLGENDGSFGTRTTARMFMKSRPYRLMLYYGDHTVLSYEISR
ncbi:MAG: hypothetical protein L6R40_002920 [Gallowayella cf. fulva]|nr:MAG: hypothetical protein L6R40_002920 [Xanthomendoza cf. fulva]